MDWPFQLGINYNRRALNNRSLYIILFYSCPCRRSGCRKGRTGQGYRGVPGTKCQGHQTSSGEISLKDMYCKMAIYAWGKFTL